MTTTLPRIPSSLFVLDFYYVWSKEEKVDTGTDPHIGHDKNPNKNLFVQLNSVKPWSPEVNRKDIIIGSTSINTIIFRSFYTTV